jgi:voltage-gated potassium channel
VTHLPDLTPGRRRKLLAVALIRALASTAILVTLYYLVPMQKVSDAGTVVVLVVGLIMVAGIVIWQIHAIVNADYPGVQGVEAFAISVPLFLLLFAASYFVVEHTSPASFSEPLTRTDALYFTVTTFSTTGFGDITAKSQGARLLVTSQMVSDLVVIGFGVKILFGAVQEGRRRRDARTDDSSSAASALSPGVNQPD